MPNFEPVVAEGRGYELRHVGPQSAIWPNPPVALPTYVLLNQPQMVARPLPMAGIPDSTDFAAGTWTGRIGDAGEFSLTFPNKDASDGIAWRDRFASDGKNQWMEICNDGYLESVCCIEKVDLKRDQIVVSGHDGLWQTKSAYERDWVTVQSPRDVIERGTQVWVPIVSDDFPASSVVAGGQLTTPSNVWAAQTSGGGTITVPPLGGVHLAVPAVASAKSLIGIPQLNKIWSTWRATCTLQAANIPSQAWASLVIGAPDPGWQLNLHGGFALFADPASNLQAQVQYPSATTYSLLIESDGEWVSAFVNGQLIGCVRNWALSGATYMDVTVGLQAGTGAAADLVVTDFIFESQQPFLQRGTDKGDYVLPGTASTYPSGGLHARYYNDADLQGNTNHLVKRLSPTRSQAYAGSGAPEYANQQDATINHAVNFAPSPGVATDASGNQIQFSVKWFGAIYLKLGSLVGNYTFSFTVDDGVRIWIGKTKWGDQIIDSWIAQPPTTYSATIACGSGSSLAGTNSDGSVSAKDGWYPIVIEYFQGAGGVNAQFSFTPPQGYTDPGGTALTGGVSVIVPASSLSPLGCVDQRHQAISHYDLITKTALAFNYQITCKPQQLETIGLSGSAGKFPGTLAPRIREGTDYDVTLTPDDNLRSEGMINYGNTLDGTDICTSLWGNGAGFQNGNTGQLQAQVFDPVHLRAALFDIQGWQDFSDASFSQLLQALLNSQLGLRLDPWQIIAGEPLGRYRLANVWPLPSNLAQFRWRPGDGLKAYARDVAIEDTSPRQLLLVTRQIHPNGTVSTSVGFAARPRDHNYALQQTLFQVRRLGRNYQRQLTTLMGSLSQAFAGVASGGAAGLSILGLLPNDQVVRAYVRIKAFSASDSWGLLLNASDITSVLNGPWSVNGPVSVDISGQIANDNGRMYVNMINKGGVASVGEVDVQLFVDVLR